MSNTSGVTYLKPENSFQQKLDNSALEVITTISDVAASECLAMLKSMFDGIDDSLFELANNARTNNEQNRFFEAMREVRIKRKGIETEFIQKLNLLFEPQRIFAKPHKMPADAATITTNSETLDVIKIGRLESDNLEEEVAINAMASKALTHYQGPLLQLTTRLASLGNQKDISQIASPLEPYVICQTFAEACTPLEIAIQERLIILKQFDRYLISNFGIVINAVNKVFIRNGILPSLKSPGIKQSIKPGPATSDAIYVQETSLGPQTQTSDQQPSLEKLLSKVRSAQEKHHKAPQKAASSSEANRHHLFIAISRIQKQFRIELEAQDRPENTIDIKQAISQEIQRNGIQKIAQQEADLVNLVSMLFDFILDDYNLAPSLQSLFNRLQIPILKSVLKDRTFFNNSKHPARQLLNSLARSGIGWTETSDVSQDALYKKMRDIVIKALHLFDDDINLFSALNHEFNQFIALEAKHADINENRTKEAEHGRIKSKQAQKKVELILSHKVLNAHYPIPDEIIEILKDNWSRVMFMAYLKDEHEHQWHNKVRVIDDLIWCLQPMTEQVDRQKWIKIVPKLLKELKSGLDSISHPIEQREEMVALVREILTQNFKEEGSSAKSSAKTPSAEKSAKPISAALKPSANENKPQPKDSLQDELTQIQQLTPGDWLEFTLGNGNKLRCKLSTRISDIDCLIFVNRMGQKSLEKSSLELAKDLKEKRAIILEKGQIIDRAMSAVLSNLRPK